MKIKKIKTAAMIALLVAAILAIGMFGFGCVSGLMPVGWSGGMVFDGSIYVVGIENGESCLLKMNLDGQSPESADPLKSPAQSGLLGCSSVLSCGGGASRVSVYGTPVVSDNFVYIAAYNGKIYGYDINNINREIKFSDLRNDGLQPFVGSVVIDGNKLFIGCSDGWLYAFDKLTGALLNSYQTGDKIWGTPTVEGDTLYIGSFDKKLYALKTADLTPKWTSPFITEGSIIAKPLVSNGIIYIGSFDKKMYAINASDGTPKWKEPFIGGNWFWAQPALVNDTLYAGCLDGFVYALKPSTGEMLDRYELGSQVASQPVVFDNYIIFASHNGDVFKINSTTREMTRIVALKEALKHDVTVDGQLTIYEGIIYIQTNDAQLQRIDVSSGAVLPSITLVSQ